MTHQLTSEEESMIVDWLTSDDDEDVIAQRIDQMSEPLRSSARSFIQSLFTDKDSENDTEA